MCKYTLFTASESAFIWFMNHPLPAPLNNIYDVHSKSHHHCISVSSKELDQEHPKNQRQPDEDPADSTTSASSVQQMVTKLWLTQPVEPQPKSLTPPVCPRRAAVASVQRETLPHQRVSQLKGILVRDNLSHGRMEMRIQSWSGSSIRSVLGERRANALTHFKQTFTRMAVPLTLNMLPFRRVLLFSRSSIISSASSFSACSQVPASLLTGPTGPPLRALQDALSCRIRAGSSRASDRPPPQVTGGILRGPQTGERGALSAQTPTSTPRPESRILRSWPHSPSSTGMFAPKES